MEFGLYAISVICISSIIVSIFFIKKYYSDSMEIIDLKWRYETDISTAKQVNKLLEEELERSRKCPPKVESYEVKELLNDLLAGKALIEVKRISPDSVFIRSIKDIKG